MSKSICIIHIEDEYHELITIWPKKLRSIVESYWLEQGEIDPVAELIDSKEGEENGNHWAMREYSCPMGTDQVYRYVFVGSVQVPKIVKTMLLDLNFFVVDVLRHGNGRNGHDKTAAKSLKSVESIGGTNDNTVLYTACQGSDLSNLKKEFPNIEPISKGKSKRLKSRIAKVVIESIGND